MKLGLVLLHRDWEHGAPKEGRVLDNGGGKGRNTRRCGNVENIFYVAPNWRPGWRAAWGLKKEKSPEWLSFGRWSILMSQQSPWVSAFFCRVNKWSNTIVKSLAQQGLAKVSYGPIVECKEVNLVCCGWKEFNMLSLLIWFHLQSIRQLKNIWKCIFCWETGRRYLLIYWMQCGGAVQRNSLFNEV